MADRNSKVIKMNKTTKVNGAIIIFFLILIYFVASLVKSLTKNPVTTYKVSSSNINNNISCQGIALRSEQEVKSTKSGYLIYFVKDGDKVNKSASVCTVDETGSVISAIQAAGQSEEGNNLFTSEDYKNIRNTIDQYKSDYSNENFASLYNFKSQIESKVMELSGQVMVQQIDAGGAQVSSTLESVTSPDSGVISYYTDGFENKTPEGLTESDFNQQNYKRTSLKSGDVQNAGATIFKICPDENWNIVCKLTNDQASKLKEETSITFTINNDPQEISADFSLLQKENCYFLVLNLSKYMINYISDRYLSIEIILDRYAGLKVPNSSLVEKETYKIPKGAVKNEEDKMMQTVQVTRTDKDGKQENKTLELTVYKEDDDYYYVDETVFDDSDMLHPASGGDAIQVLSLEREKITGVYLGNQGVADFLEVSIVKSEDEFTIVNSGEGLKEYDNIVQDSSSVVENQTLY